MKQFILGCSLFLLLGMACKDSSPTSSTTSSKEYLTKDIPASFMDFYERFHNDEDYQMEHIVFPLAGIEQDTATLETHPIQWLKEEWLPHKPFNSYGGTFTRDFTNLNGIILEKIEDTGKTFSMERRFSFMQGEWNLIYYSTFEMKKE